MLLKVPINMIIIIETESIKLASKMYSYRLIWFYRGLEQAANKIRLFLDRLTVGLRQRKA